MKIGFIFGNGTLPELLLEKTPNSVCALIQSQPKNINHSRALGFCILLYTHLLVTLEFKIESLTFSRLLPKRYLFDFTDLKDVYLEVDVWLKFSSIQSISGSFLL